MSEKYLEALAVLILQKMEEQGLTIAQFADSCGVSRRVISKIKNREAGNIRLDTLVKICNYHGILYQDIFGQESGYEKAYTLIDKNNRKQVLFSKRA